MRRALGTLLTGLLLLGIATIGAVLLENRGAEFEARGSRVSGVVVEVQHVKGGDSIVVIYDPDAPENVAVPGIPYEPAWVSILMGLIALAGLSTFIIRVTHLSRAVLARRKPGVQRRSTN